MHTRLFRLTATRCFLGQAVMEVPDFARADRLAEIIGGGGALATLLGRSIAFDRMDGTGLANPYLSTASAVRDGELFLPFSTISAALRRDGFQFGNNP